MLGLEENINGKIQGLIILGFELREPVVSYSPVFDPPKQRVKPRKQPEMEVIQ